jgi:Fe-S oxidoreductase
MALCVGCKACRHECPTGVDMAKMKVEFLHHYHARHGLPLRERLIAWLPRYAPHAARLRGLLNLRDRVPGLAVLSERLLGLAAGRPLPVWCKPWRESGRPARPEDIRGDGRDLVLLADTFNRYFEPATLAAAERVLRAAGYRLHPAPGDGRPLCCGRTFLAAGQVARARTEARRMLEALSPLVERGVRVVGLEPSCLLTLRDEFLSLLPGPRTRALANAALLFEEALAQDAAAGLVTLPLADAAGRVAHLHGHCHQKAFGAMDAVAAVLGMVPGLAVRRIESGCCGMAGAFGYQAETLQTSKAMGELALLPAVRAAAPDDWIVADGTSCRSQIADATGRRAQLVAHVLEEYLMDARRTTAAPVAR